MALPTNRVDFENYVLRSLGAPVTEINISQEQLNDRIDEAIETWSLYSADGLEDMWLKHTISASTIVIDSATVPEIGTSIRGDTSKVLAWVTAVSGNVITLSAHTPATIPFIVGETVHVVSPTTTFDATVTAFTNGDAQNGYIPTDPNIYGINKVFPVSSIYNTNAQDLFSINYQIMITSLRDISHVDMAYYKQVMQQVDLMYHELTTIPDFRFNRYTNRLYLDVDWSIYKPSEVLLVKTQTVLDQVAYGQMFKDPLLFRLAVALVKRQWGANMKKFGAIQLPGGVTLNGKELYDEGVEEQKEVEDLLISKMPPMGFLMG